MLNNLYRFLLAVVLVSTCISLTTLSQNVADVANMDSVYKGMSINDRISQLFLLDFRELPPEYHETKTCGGVLVKEANAEKYRDMWDSRGNGSGNEVIVMAEMDLKGGIGLQGLPAYGTPSQLERVEEPHLFYEIGKAIAHQSKALKIHAVVELRRGIEQSYLKAENNWRIAEMKQGMADGGILPIQTFQIIDVDDLSISQLVSANQPTLILLKPEEVEGLQTMISKALAEEDLSPDQLEDAVKRILSIKRQLSNDRFPSHIEPMMPERSFFYGLDFEIAKASIRLLNIDRQLLPVPSLSNTRVLSVNFNRRDSVFQEFLGRYTQVDHRDMDYESNSSTFDALKNELQQYDVVVFALHQPKMSSHLENDDFQVFLASLRSDQRAIFVSFLESGQLKSLMPLRNLLVAPEDTSVFHTIAPQLIFGGLQLSDNSPDGAGKAATQRLAYTYPASVGMKPQVLSSIDSIAVLAISEGATPGCQILVAKNNEVVYQKSFGYHTYDSLQKVHSDDQYDLASITKVSGALPALMKLYEEGRFDLDATLGTYVKYFKRGNKKKLTYREILAHQAGLKPWIPYWKTTLRKNGRYRRKTLSPTYSAGYPHKLADGLYLHKDYKKKIYRQIRKSKLGNKDYLYSGLIFYVFPDVIEAISGQKFVDYVYDNFYRPLGATTLRYRPDLLFDLDRIVPTEYDSMFRKSQIHGLVHDEGAAMMEGISSNAGLFSNANDLSKLFQMYCNYGSFGGRRYLKESTVREFTRCQYPENDNRRALGFDRPLPQPVEDGNTALSVSQSSFGHSGFTGTFAWADPQYNIVYIFLSNRVYPTRTNTKLYELNIRTNIQEVIYQSMKDMN
jgi:beta-N-acetylhexosaminidase